MKTHKTAISIPQSIYNEAEALARKLHVSRSRLYVMALEFFVKTRQKDDLTQRIDDYINEHGQPHDDAIVKRSRNVLTKTVW